jgi:hypothetical protein
MSMILTLEDLLDSIRKEIIGQMNSQHLLVQRDINSNALHPEINMLVVLLKEL